MGTRTYARASAARAHRPSENGSRARAAREILETAHEAFVSMDSAGRICDWNPQAESVFGFSRAEAVGAPLAELIVPERYREAHWRALERFVATGESPVQRQVLELSALHRDGHEIPIELTISSSQTDAGWVFDAFVRDVSERKRAERALREAEERFRRAFEDSAVGMALVGAAGDEIGRLLEVNRALSQMTGYAIDELLGMSAAALVYPDDREPAGEDAGHLLADALPASRGDRRWLHAAGHAIWVQASRSVVRDDAGAPLYEIVQAQDITERRRSEGELRYLADHDPLTGLLNRRRFEEELARELALVGRYGSQGAVLAFDLDDFKQINDAVGHSAGDDLLTDVANVLRRRLRQTDVLARLGGDEFAVVLPRADEAQARSVAEGILRSVREDLCVPIGSGYRRVTTSIGVALFGASRGQGAREPLAEADAAMYDAKAAGRDRVAVHSGSSADERAHASSTVNWAQRIRDALAHDRLVLEAQPIVSLDGDPVARHELLIRMLDTDGELIPPGTFLYLAERFDLVQELDRWALGRAIGLLAERRRSDREVRLTVNISARSIADPELPGVIGARLAEAGVDPSALCVEVTETNAIARMDDAKRLADGLREQGCELALDDFGAGFASFYYLKHIALDYLKIDGEFITGLPENHTNQLLVKSVVDIARGLGKATIAKRVGDAETVELLRAYGVDYVQGYHVGRPVPIESGELGNPPVL